MDKFKSHFQFNKQERSGIFFLLLLICVLLIVRYAYDTWTTAAPLYSAEVDTAEQQRIDSLKLAVKNKEGLAKTYPFNPNYITDYKGYILGMSTEEIDRLHRFRNNGSFINSVADFQKVTLVSDSLLLAISPNFKFPDWVNKKKARNSSKSSAKKAQVVQDINAATVEDLRSINGIGEKLSARILKFRNRLGGFRSMDILYDVYGLDSALVNKVQQGFKIQSNKTGVRLNLNTASEKELAEFVYFGKAKARKIAAYRYAKSKIESLEDLFNNIGIPINKIDRIALYLSL